MEARQDAFLGGRLRLWQPVRGYRAGGDPVLLAASVPAQAGQAVLDVGCGVGTAALCLSARVPGVAVTGLERQETAGVSTPWPGELEQHGRHEQLGHSESHGQGGGGCR